MQALERLAVPVEIGQEEEAFVAGLAELSPVDDVLHFGSALDDVEYPIESPLFPLELHKRPDVILVNLGRLRDEPHALLAVLFDMGLRARIDEVDFQVGKEVDAVVVPVVVASPFRLGLVVRRPRPRHAPRVNVVGAQVPQPRQRRRQAGEVDFGRGERRPLDDHDGGLVVDCAVEGDAAAGLVCAQAFDQQLEFTTVDSNLYSMCLSTLVEHLVQLELGHRRLSPGFQIRHCR